MCTSHPDLVCPLFVPSTFWFTCKHIPVYVCVPSSTCYPMQLVSVYYMYCVLIVLRTALLFQAFTHTCDLIEHIYDCDLLSGRCHLWDRCWLPGQSLTQEKGLPARGMVILHFEPVHNMGGSDVWVIMSDGGLNNLYCSIYQLNFDLRYRRNTVLTIILCS